MSHHIDTVKTIYGCFGNGDVAGILSHLADDVEWEHDWGATPLPLYVPRRGREAVRGFFGVLAAYEFVQFEPMAFLAGDNMVAVPIRLELKVRATGKVIRDLEAHLWAFAPSGKVARFRHLCDTLQFAEAART